MKAIKFKECNVTFAENQPEYLPLPAHKSPGGRVTSCWGFSFLERVRVALRGKIYLQILTFNEPLQPLLMSVHNPVSISDLTDLEDLNTPPGPADYPRPKKHNPVG